MHKTIIGAITTLLLAVTASPASAAPGDIAWQESIPNLGVQQQAYLTAGDFGVVQAYAEGSDVSITYWYYNGDSPVDTFGTNGVGTIAVPGVTTLRITDITRDGEGRFLVSGYAADTGGAFRMFLVRFTVDGDPDLSFSGDGVAKIVFSQGESIGYGVAARGTRAIIVGEVTLGTATNPAAAVVGNNGKLVKSFGKSGRKMYAIDSGDDDADAVWRAVPGPKGTWVLSGWNEDPSGMDDTLIMRIRPDGALDQTFAGKGAKTYDLNGGDEDFAYGLVKRDGRYTLAVAGDINAPKLFRVLGNGKRDSSFATNGLGVYLSPYPFAIREVVIDSQDRILANGLQNLGVMRVLPNGVLDTGFHADGFARNTVSNALGYDIITDGGVYSTVGGAEADVSTDWTTYFG